jgi:hypothetical protein
MDTDKVNRGLTLAANVGVLGGLILVAFQIHQNTEITKAQIANDYYLADMQLELAMMGDNPANSWTKAIYTPNDLTNEDTAIVDRYFNYGLVQILRLQKMHELGLADDDWENRIGYLGWHLGNEVGRRWWAYSKEGFPDDFIQMVDEVLTMGEHRDNQDLLDALMPQTDAAPSE